MFIYFSYGNLRKEYIFEFISNNTNLFENDSEIEISNSPYSAFEVRKELQFLEKIENILGKI